MTNDEIVEEIVRTLRPADPGSWEVNKVYVRERLRGYNAEMAVPESALDKCPTCGSADKNKFAWSPICGRPDTRDPWHRAVEASPAKEAVPTPRCSCWLCNEGHVIDCEHCESCIAQARAKEVEASPVPESAPKTAKCVEDCKDGVHGYGCANDGDNIAVEASPAVPESATTETEEDSGGVSLLRLGRPCHPPFRYIGEESASPAPTNRVREVLEEIDRLTARWEDYYTAFTAPGFVVTSMKGLRQCIEELSDLRQRFEKELR